MAGRICRALLYLAIGITTAGCSPDEVFESDRVADPPLGRVRVYGNEVAIEPAAGVNWRDLVDLSLFEALRPRMTLAEARKVAGDPDRQEGTARGTDYIYLRPRARIVLAAEKHGSTFGSYSGWFLRAYPDRLRVEDLFAPAIAAELKREETRREVVLMKTSQDPALRATVAGGLVLSVEWVSE